MHRYSRLNLAILRTKLRPPILPVTERLTLLSGVRRPENGSFFEAKITLSSHSRTERTETFALLRITMRMAKLMLLCLDHLVVRGLSDGHPTVRRPLWHSV